MPIASDGSNATPTDPAHVKEEPKCDLKDIFSKLSVFRFATDRGKYIPLNEEIRYIPPAPRMKDEPIGFFGIVSMLRDGRVFTQEQDERRMASRPVDEANVDFFDNISKFRFPRDEDDPNDLFAKISMFKARCAKS